ncbi:MAG: 50S ribosomal protein L13 [Candidatus Omnitrophota bacterium]
MKTTLTKKDDTKRKYYLVNVEDQILGRVAGRIALLLSGKRKTDYTPNVDGGDFVVVINAGKVKTTGLKKEKKIYTRYTGYPGGLKSQTLETMLEKNPTFVIRHAVKGMLPKNKLGSRMITRLKIYTESGHPHQAQMPEEVKN